MLSSGRGASITSVAYAGGVSVVTSKKLLGGFYGYQIAATFLVPPLKIGKP